MDPAVMANEGRIMSWMLAAGSWVNGTYPVAGNQCSPTAKTATMIGAMTNGGRASMPKVLVVEMLSRARLGRREVTRASGMATRKAITWEMMISSTSMGHPDLMVAVTGWWLRYDWPRLPWNTPFSQITYWCHSGRFRPSCWSRMARLWAVSLAPRMTTVGSPGNRCTSRNTSTEMMNATTTSWRNRRRKYLAMVVGTRRRWPVRLSVQPHLGREDDAFVESVAGGATGQS